MFYPLVHGAPNSSSCAALNILNALRMPSSQFVPPFALKPEMAETRPYFTSVVARYILSEQRVQAQVLNYTAPTQSALLRVLTTSTAASMVRPIRLPSYMDPDVSIIRMTFLAPAVAATYQGLQRGSQSQQPPVAGQDLKAPVEVPINARPYLFFLPSSRAWKSSYSRAEVQTNCFSSVDRAFNSASGGKLTALDSERKTPSPTQAGELGKSVKHFLESVPLHSQQENTSQVAIEQLHRLSKISSIRKAKFYTFSSMSNLNWAKVSQWILNIQIAMKAIPAFILQAK